MPLSIGAGSGAFVSADFRNLKKGDYGVTGCELIDGTAGVPLAPRVTISFTAPTRGDYVLSIGVTVISRAGGYHWKWPSAHTSVSGTISSVTLTPPAG